MRKDRVRNSSFLQEYLEEGRQQGLVQGIQ